MVEIEGELLWVYLICYFIWYEIVNDQVGDIFVVVIFCLFCNFGIIFDCCVGDCVLSFGVLGKLCNLDMVMYDCEIESWWQQVIGMGIVGEMNGVEFMILLIWMESWCQFVECNLDGLVMVEFWFGWFYGCNFYVNYDSFVWLFFYQGENLLYGILLLVCVICVGDCVWFMMWLCDVGEVIEVGVMLIWIEGQVFVLDGCDIVKSKEVGIVCVKDVSGKDLVYDVMFVFVYYVFWLNGEWMLGDG